MYNTLLKVDSSFVAKIKKEHLFLVNSMAVTATFSALEPYRLNGVTVTDREMGHGVCTTVLELEYMGLKCAGKMINEVQLRQGGASYTVRHFEEECRQLSQTRHPNILQFLGVHFQQGVSTPILVMEFLPTNLTSCIEQYGILPKEISYSILHDVALGLCYLHSQTPPIVHRDLSSNNVLLTPNMTAKICDLGVARMLNVTPLQVSWMIHRRTNPFMPLEVMTIFTNYDTSIDVYSYGILMNHMFSGRWPDSPQVGPSQVDGDRLILVTEAERREVFLQAIENDHPLMDLISRCINNDPKCRPHASEIVDRMAAMMQRFPVSFFANGMEMLRRVNHLEEEKRALREEGEEQVLELKQKIQDKDLQILSYNTELEQVTLRAETLGVQNQLNEATITRLRGEAEQLGEICHSEVEQLKLQVDDLNAQNHQKEQTILNLEEEIEDEIVQLSGVYHNEFEQLQAQNKQTEQELKQIAEEKKEIVQLNVVLSSKVEQQKLQIRDLNAQNQLIATTKEAVITEMKTKTVIYENQIEQLEARIETNETTMHQEREEIIRKREELKVQLAKERESCKRLTDENNRLQTELSQFLKKTDSLKHKMSMLEAETLRKSATIVKDESALTARAKALEEKEVIITGMNEQLTRTRKQLLRKQQVSRNLWLGSTCTLYFHVKFLGSLCGFRVNIEN